MTQKHWPWVHGPPYGPVQIGLLYGPVHGPLLRTTPKNRRNVEVCEIVDSDKVSWNPGMMPYDPLDTIWLIQQPIDFLLDFFRTFELNLNYIAIAVSICWMWNKRNILLKNETNKAFLNVSLFRHIRCFLHMFYPENKTKSGKIDGSSFHTPEQTSMQNWQSCLIDNHMS